MWRKNSHDDLWAAQELARQLVNHKPTVVIGISRAGARLGTQVARHLEVRFIALDIAYPASRPALGRFGEGVLFPVKELLYRWSQPRLRGPLPTVVAQDRIALIDDSASSGRTLRTALGALAEAGATPEQITVAVTRCGQAAQALVNVFLRA